MHIYNIVVAHRFCVLLPLMPRKKEKNDGLLTSWWTCDMNEGKVVKVSLGLLLLL